MSFEKSTQAKEWLFTQTQILDLKYSVFNSAIFKYGINITFESYLKYLQFYADDLIRMANNISSWNRFQKYTALIFYQRIFLKASIWDIPPPIAAINCLFLVSKFVIPAKIEDLIKVCKPLESVLNTFNIIDNISKYEIKVLEALKFHLKIHLPFNLVFSLTNNQFSEKIEFEIVQKIKELLEVESLFYYPPGFIAIVATSLIIGLEKTLELLPEPIINIEQQINECLTLKKINYDIKEINEFEKIILNGFKISNIIQSTSENDLFSKSILP